MRKEFFVMLVVLTILTGPPFLYIAAITVISLPWGLPWVRRGYDMGGADLAFGFFICTFIPFAITLGLWYVYYVTGKKTTADKDIPGSREQSQSPPPHDDNPYHSDGNL